MGTVGDCAGSDSYGFICTLQRKDQASKQPSNKKKTSEEKQRPKCCFPSQQQNGWYLKQPDKQSQLEGKGWIEADMSEPCVLQQEQHSAGPPANTGSPCDLAILSTTIHAKELEVEPPMFAHACFGVRS